jgi:hypothetical protein
MNRNELQQMADAYIEAALFTADEELITPKSGEFDQTLHLSRVTKAMKATALRVSTAFYDANAKDLESYPADSAGHDLWYTRNGHGCGFWEADHCTDEEGKRLSDAAHKLGESYLYGVKRWFYFA